MSRYVHVELAGFAEAELLAGLARLGLHPQRADLEGERVMLAGSLECAGEPVDLRLPAGSLGSIEDFGFALEAGRWRLICGDIDRATIAGSLTAALLEQRSEQAGIELEHQLEPDGTRRLRVRDDE